MAVISALQTTTLNLTLGTKKGGVTMPRVTKEMLAHRVEFLNSRLDAKDHEIELLKMEVSLLRSPCSAPGQLTVQLITIQRLGEALAHVIEKIQKKP